MKYFQMGFFQQSGLMVNRLAIHLRTRFWKPKYHFVGENVSKVLQEAIRSEKPFLAGKIGSIELANILVDYNYETMNYRKLWLFKFLLGEAGESWRTKCMLERLKVNAGVFPIEEEQISLFSKKFLSALKNLDYLGSWLYRENELKNILKNTRKFPAFELEPFNNENPWTLALANKRVLVVSPFKESITEQYGLRDKLYGAKKVLPDFKLKTVRAWQTNGLNQYEGKTWYACLKDMQTQIGKQEFDIALIAAGSYSLPIGDFIKTEMHKQAIHLGGSLQVLFGIYGKRWEHKNLHFFDKNLLKRPYAHERPKGYELVENGCYW